MNKTIWRKVTMVGVAMAVICGILAVIHGTVTRPTDSQLALGRRHLAESAYDKAAAVFTEVVDEEPRNIEGYLGLVHSYLGLDDVPKAIAISEVGYEATGSETDRKSVV